MHNIFPLCVVIFNKEHFLVFLVCVWVRAPNQTINLLHTNMVEVGAWVSKEKKSKLREWESENKNYDNA